MGIVLVGRPRRSFARTGDPDRLPTRTCLCFAWRLYGETVRLEFLAQKVGLLPKNSAACPKSPDLAQKLCGLPKKSEFSGKAPRWNAYTGAILAFVGILLLTAPASVQARGHAAVFGGIAAMLPDFSSVNSGDVLTFGCAIGFAFHCLALSHVSPRIPFQPLALLQVGFCALFMAISLPIIEHPQIHFTLKLVVALAIASALATAAAFSIQSWAQAILPSTHIALLLTMEPVFAWIASFVFTGERLGIRPAVGAFLILSGIALTELVPQPHVPSAHEA